MLSCGTIHGIQKDQIWNKDQQILLFCQKAILQMKTRLLEVGEKYVDSSSTAPLSKTVVLQQKGGYIIQNITEGAAHSIYVPNETFQRPV